MDKWQIEERIKYLELLNEDPVERESVKRMRATHIEFLKQKLESYEQDDKVE
jgi:hypothetical protein